MKKFALVTIGFTQPTKEIMASWTQQFKSIEDKIVDHLGLSNGKEVTKVGVTALSMDIHATTGCLVINAESMDEAIQIDQNCPMISITKVYEVMSHKTAINRTFDFAYKMKIQGILFATW